MIDFSTLQGLTIPEGAVTQVADSQGRIIWMLQSGDNAILEVEKITSDTVAGETTYTGEQFILLDIYPKTNGTVSVTYGGLTKTITDTSGVEEPNAQQVFFGTFNGVTDEVETPASGTLTIEGDFYAFGCSIFKNTSKAKVGDCNCITGVADCGNITRIPYSAFSKCEKITNIQIPISVQSIENVAFSNCTGLTSVSIPSDVTSIGINAFNGCTALGSVIFENVDGWYVTETGGATSGIAIDVSDATNNVTLITDTYRTYYWYRS